MYSLAAFLLLGGLSAVRYSVGVDYSYIYAPAYEPILADPLGPFTPSRFEWGFVLLEKATALCSKNYQMLFVVTSLLIAGLTVLYYHRYSPNVFLSVFLFITLSQFYCSMNFIRQTLAAVVCMYAFPFLQRKKFVPAALLILFAALFHKSALMMLIFAFLCQIPLTPPVLAVFTAGTGLIYWNTERILSFVTRFVYKTYDAQNIHMTATFPFPFTAAALVLFLLLYAGRRHLLQAGKENGLYLSYAFFSLFFILMGTRHSILDRLALYFEMILPVAVPVLLCQLRRESSAPIPAPPQSGGSPEFSLSGARAALEQQKMIERQKAGVRRRAAYYAACLIVFGGGLCYHHYALRRDHHGVTPYRIIFAQPFYKEYVQSLRAPSSSAPPTDEPNDGPIDGPVDRPADAPVGESSG